MMRMTTKELGNNINIAILLDPKTAAQALDFSHRVKQHTSAGVGFTLGEGAIPFLPLVSVPQTTDLKTISDFLALLTTRYPRSLQVNLRPFRVDPQTLVMNWESEPGSLTPLQSLHDQLIRGLNLRIPTLPIYVPGIPIAQLRANQDIDSALRAVGYNQMGSFGVRELVIGKGTPQTLTEVTHSFKFS